MNSSPLALNLHIDNWGVSPISDNAIFIKDGTHGTHKRVSKGIPLLSAKNITPSGKIYWDSEDSQVSDDDYYKIHSKYELAKSDLLLTVVGTLGRSALVTGEGKFTIQRSVAVIRINQHKVLPSFIYQFCSTDFFQKQLELRSNATAQAGVYLGELAKIPLPVPPLPEQQKIAAILTSVDDVIEKTQAQINKLKNLKTGMMQELLTRGVGVDGKPHTEFKDSPVGRIPKGWTHRMIGDVSIKVGSGVTPKGGSEAYVDFGIPLIRSQNVYSDGLRLGNVSYITQKQHEKMRNSQLKPKDVLLNITGASIGRCFYLDDAFEEGNVNQHVCIIRINAEVIDNVYLSYVLNSDIGQRQIMSLQAGGNREGLNFQQIKEINIPLPSLGEQKAITKSLKAVENNIFKLEEKNAKNQAMKKALMQDLLTGKVRVNVD